MADFKKRTIEELGRLSVQAYREQPKMPVYLVLDNVRSALNVGSAFRTADAFEVREIVLCGITATPPHREILKTALGASESVAWSYAEHTVDAVAALRRAGCRIWAVEQTEYSTPLQDVQMEAETPIALIFGNEVGGVSDEVIQLADGVLEVPQFGAKHSLNISVCVGVVLWELFRKWKFQKA